ncbi:hypothetical protein Pfo_026763 [Paulownia fortunei]|nr:hypothetical protein Pfo_026763 [Paulownia fortunei]
MPPPRHIKHVQQLTGKLAALNRFISRSVIKGLPFFKIEECQHVFDDLKKYLVSSPLLTKPEVGETLFLYLAVATEAISVVLVQKVGRAHRPIYYTSKILQGAEQRYPNIEKLALALITATRKLRPYFQSHPVVVLTNHPLKQVLSNPETSGRLVKWVIKLNEHGIEFRPRPVIKAQVLVDFEVEMTADEIINSLFAWTLYVDGSSTSTGSGAGIAIKSPQGDKFEYALKFEFLTSNDEAEYEALLAGFKLAFAAGARKLTIYSDSQLVVNQVRGEYEGRDEKMIKYLSLTHDMLAKLEEYKIKRIPRTDNTIVDQLAKLASSMANNIVQYLTMGELSDNPVDARKLKTRAARFLIIDGELYKRGFSQPYLKCFTLTKANYVFHEIYEGIYGNHLGGYFWPTIQNDARDLIMRCQVCQEYINIQHRPPAPLYPIESPYPFAQWGMDIVGPFPPATGQRKFLIVTVDYFTKWVEKNIICRFGIPRALISDNGINSQEQKYKNANRQIKVTNQIISQHLKTRLGITIGESLFNLIYGTDAITPAEIREPSWRMTTYAPQHNDIALRVNLDLIEELRKKAASRSEIYKARMVRAYNMKAHSRSFQVGDLVLRKAE